MPGGRSTRSGQELRRTRPGGLRSFAAGVGRRARRGGSGRRTPRPRSRPTAARPAGRLEERRGAPVGGEPARVRGEQDDVDGAGGREQVLAVLVGVAGQLRARDDERRRPAELRGLVRLRRRRRAGRRSRGRSRGSATARSDGGSAPSARARAVPRSSRGRRAPARRPCASGVTGSPTRRPRPPR